MPERAVGTCGVCKGEGVEIYKSIVDARGRGLCVSVPDCFERWQLWAYPGQTVVPHPSKETHG